MKPRDVDPALLVISAIFAVIGFSALVFPDVSISAQRKVWALDTRFLGSDAALFGLLSLTIAYVVARVAFHMGWRIIWQVELPLLGVLYAVAAALHRISV